MGEDKRAWAWLTTPPGRGGIAVIALGGEGAAEIVSRVFRPGRSHTQDEAGRLRLGHIVDGQTVIDEAVVCKLRAAGDNEGRGAKGEERNGDSEDTGKMPVPHGVYEINIHGGALAARQVMELLENNGAKNLGFRISQSSTPVWADFRVFEARMGGLKRSAARDGAQCGDRGIASETAKPAGENVQAISDDGEKRAIFPPAHPRWNNPAIGKELLEAISSARSELAVAALTAQWSAGISELASDLLEEIEGRKARSEEREARSEERRAKGEERNSNNKSNTEETATTAMGEELRRAAEGLEVFRKLLSPCEVVVVGRPNAGKSTLVNALVGREVSIVHETPGTTRDWVREEAIFFGVPVWLTDTAGLWEKCEGIDAEAVRRARQRAIAAELVVVAVSPHPSPLPEGAPHPGPLPRGEGEGAEAGGGKGLPQWLAGKTVLHVATKSDIARANGKFDAAVSARTGEGLTEAQAGDRAGAGAGRYRPAVRHGVHAAAGETSAGGGRGKRGGRAAGPAGWAVGGGRWTQRNDECLMSNTEQRPSAVLKPVNT